MNSRRKGKRGEREARDVVRRYLGFPQVFRSAQAAGSLSADLGGTGALHVEVKRPARLGAEKYLLQAERDAEPGKVPVVLTRQDRGEWILMVRVRNVDRLVGELNLARSIRNVREEIKAWKSIHWNQDRQQYELNDQEIADSNGD